MKENHQSEKDFRRTALFLENQRMPMYLCLKKLTMDASVLPVIHKEQRLGHLPYIRFVLSDTNWPWMLGFTKIDKTRNEDVRARTEVKNIIQKSVETKGQWVGHLAQFKNQEWAQK